MTSYQLMTMLKLRLQYLQAAVQEVRSAGTQESQGDYISDDNDDVLWLPCMTAAKATCHLHSFSYFLNNQKVLLMSFISLSHLEGAISSSNVELK